MEKSAIAAVLHEKNHDYEMKQIQLGKLNDDEVLIKVSACGICHTDFVAENMLPLPAVFGHEGAGIVEEVGPSVRSLAVGDRVVMSYPSCGACDGCQQGQPFHCDHHMGLGFSGKRLDGTSTLAPESSEITASFFQQSAFATHSIANERNLVKIEGDFSDVLLAAIPCGVQTGAGSIINTFDINSRNSVAVFGVGAVGLSAIMAAKLCGASPIIAIDVVPSRLDLAMDLGATHVIDAREGDVSQKILSITKHGVHYSLETSANEQALNDSIACLATGGTSGMVIAPHFGEKYPFSPTTIFHGAKTLKGIVQGSSIPGQFLPNVLRWHQDGNFPIDKMIQEYKFNEINKAAADTKSGEVIKAVLTM
jgi:aryl-alcohol dehydrogenase